jgi:hypothetical protein
MSKVEIKTAVTLEMDDELKDGTLFYWILMCTGGVLKRGNWPSKCSNYILDESIKLELDAHLAKLLDAHLAKLKAQKFSGAGISANGESFVILGGEQYHPWRPHGFALMQVTENEAKAFFAANHAFADDEGIDALTGKIRKMEIYEARDDRGEIVRLGRFGKSFYGTVHRVVCMAAQENVGNCPFEVRCFAFMHECLRAEKELKDAEKDVTDSRVYVDKLLGADCDEP